MRSKVSKYLSQPAPVNEKPWLSVLLCVAIVIFILAIFEPFNFRLNSLGQVWVLVGFALLTMLVTSIALFIRCHRAFIVNINYISNAEGNAQGYPPLALPYLKSHKRI